VQYFSYFNVSTIELWVENIHLLLFWKRFRNLLELASLFIWGICGSNSNPSCHAVVWIRHDSDMTVKILYHIWQERQSVYGCMCKRNVPWERLRYQTLNLCSLIQNDWYIFVPSRLTKLHNILERFSNNVTELASENSIMIKKSDSTEISFTHGSTETSSYSKALKFPLSIR